MARYHYEGDVVFLDQQYARDLCTDDACTREHVHVFTDAELEQRDAEQYRNDIRLDYGV